MIIECDDDAPTRVAVYSNGTATHALPLRSCWFCARPIAECMGFTLTRDLLAQLQGSFVGQPRELCQFCADKLSEIIKGIELVKEHKNSLLRTSPPMA